MPLGRGYLGLQKRGPVVLFAVLAAVAVAATVPPPTAPSASPTAARGQSYDELILLGATELPGDPEAWFARAAAQRFDVAHAVADVSSDDPARRARAQQLLANGIARHVTYAGTRFRIDELNAGRATLQHCEEPTAYLLDLDAGTARPEPINPVATAYALGADLTVRPGTMVATSGNATIEGTREAVERYELNIAFRSAAGVPPIASVTIRTPH